MNSAPPESSTVWQAYRLGFRLGCLSPFLHPKMPKLKPVFLLPLILWAGLLAAHAQQPRSLDILRDAILSGASKGSDVTLLRKGEVASKDKFAPPIRITYVAKTNSTDIRIGYAATQIIFNWRDDQAQLRIDGGPANGRHLHGAGKVPKNTFVTIVQEVTPTRMTLSVDGVQRASWDGDFSKVNEQVRVFPGDSVVTVRSIHAESLK